MYNGPDNLMTDRQRGDRKLHTDRLRQRLGGRQVNGLTELIKIQRHTDGHLQHCWGKFTNRQTSPEWRETVGIVTELTAQKCVTNGTISLTIPKLFLMRLQYLDFE